MKDAASKTDFTKIIGNDWDNSEYYTIHESENHLNLFWGELTVFKRLFYTLDHKNIIEIACGYGRHVPKYQHLASTIKLVDINQSNIDHCQKRFANEKKITFYTNSGSDISKIPDESATAVFSYDAMVHFELLDIISYLSEFYRVLKPGGRALVHHSNNHSNPGGDPHWHATYRNFMSADIFHHIANRAGFRVLEQQLLHWGGFNNIDCVTMLQKNAAVAKK